MQAIQAGTQAGLALRSAAIQQAAQAQRAQEAAAQLQLQYQQLQSHQQQAMAQLEATKERAMASDLLRAQQQNALNLYRENQAKMEKERIGLERERLNAPTAMQKDISAATALRQAADQKRQSGDEAGAKADEYKLALMEGRMMGPSETIETTPQGTVIRRGKAATETSNQPTTAFKSQLQQQLYDSDITMKLLDYAEKNQNASDYGVRGNLKQLLSQWGPQIGIEVDPKTMDVRNTLRIVRAAMIRSLKSDSNITEAERKQLLEALPSESISESVPSAISKLNAVKSRMAIGAQSAAKQLGVPVPEWAIQVSGVGQTQELAIKQRYQRKEITLDQAMDEIKKLQQGQLQPR